MKSKWKLYLQIELKSQIIANRNFISFKTLNYLKIQEISADRRVVYRSENHLRIVQSAVGIIIYKSNHFLLIKQPFDQQIKKQSADETIIRCTDNSLIWLRWFRSSRPEVLCKKGVLRNFTKFTGKHLCQSLFLNKVAGLRPATLLKKRLWHRCFSVNFVRFLRTPFSIEYLWWLLLMIVQLTDPQIILPPTDRALIYLCNYFKKKKINVSIYLNWSNIIYFLDSTKNVGVS